MGQEGRVQAYSRAPRQALALHLQCLTLKVAACYFQPLRWYGRAEGLQKASGLNK